MNNDLYKNFTNFLTDTSNHLKCLDRNTILNSLIAILGVYIVILIISLFINLFTKRKSQKLFTIKLISTVLTGGTIAFMLPYALDIDFKGPGNDGGALRQQILLATGGILALVTLLENRKKNENEKEKNEKNYQRQVSDERRERYIKSLDLLGSNDFLLKLGGIYSLCKIADEWLEENNDLEAQNIIDILCAYIRSPYTLALYKYTKPIKVLGKYSYRKQLSEEELDELEQEKTLRKSIVDEITKRTQIQGDSYRDGLWITSFKSYMNNKNTPIWKFWEWDWSELPKLQMYRKPGPWSHLDFNFSGSLFFYPVNFEGCRWSESLDISHTTHIYKFDISNSIFDHTAYFHNNTYYNDFISSKTWFTYRTSFHESVYHKNLIFDLNYHWKLPELTKSVFLGTVNVYDSKIHKNILFKTLRNEPSFRGIVNNSSNIYVGSQMVNINYIFPVDHTIDFSNSKFSESKKFIYIGNKYDKNSLLSEGFTFLTSDEEEKISHDPERYINNI
ncbi:hypothetical protein HMPREF2609_09575 [Rothia sp. HMSC058E10]|jgi:hypothetical protein|uniref:hypothetical protein n=1 Tax=Rothia sp. HMSC058E10 TaxID=1715088 RepID=UPI0008A43B8D|nr:hypothetical protein [Rothia sp. HMSC058E10]OFN15118.1 hypothetical protein HMPREF2609_09575 [Rothia sp. HMSC058E10]